MTLDKQKFQEYAELKQKKKEIEGRLDELKPEIEQQMKDNDGRPVESEYGKFTLVKNTVGYEWPDSIKEKENEVDKQKQQAKANGTAEPKEVEYVQFRSTDNE